MYAKFFTREVPTKKYGYGHKKIMSGSGMYVLFETGMYIGLTCGLTKGIYSQLIYQSHEGCIYPTH